jgi:hypothetical protein
MESGVWLCTAKVHEGDRIMLMEKFGIRKHRRYPMMQCLICETTRDLARAAQVRQDTADRRRLNGWGLILIEGDLAMSHGGCYKCEHDHMGACRGEVSIGLPMWCESIWGHDIVEARRLDPDKLRGTNFMARLIDLAPFVLPHLVGRDTIVTHTQGV